MKPQKTLEDFHRKIEYEIDKAGPYSHNIIGIVLRQIDKQFGVEAANNAIEFFALDEMGWSKKKSQAGAK